MSETRQTPRRRRRRRRNPYYRPLCAAAVILAAALALWWMNRPLPGERIQLPQEVQVDLIPKNEWSRPGDPLKEIHGVVIHYVGNPGTTAQANRNYFASLADGREQTFASSHFVVGLDGEVVQCVPLTEIAYATKQRNVDTISIEVCHPDETGQFNPVTYREAVELTAWLCRECHLDPETEVIRHYDVTGKICPKYYVDHPEAWEQFKADVKEVMNFQTMED